MTTQTHAIQQPHGRTAHARPTAPAVRSADPRPRRALPGLVGGDVAALVAAVAVLGAPLWVLAFAPAVLAALAVRGQYAAARPALLDTLRDLVMSVVTIAGGLTLGVAAAAPAALDPVLARTALLALALLLVHRCAVALGRRGEPGTPVVILGGGEAADELARLLSADPTAGLRPVAALGLDLSDHARDADVRGLARLAREAGGREVLVLPGGCGEATLRRIARACAAEGLGVTVRSALGDAGGALAVQQAGPVSLVRVRAVDTADPRLVLKHAADRVAAALLLLAVAPLFAGIALAVRLSSPGPVLFRQRRVGRDGREFEMLKFRSMRTAPDTAATPLLLPAGSAPGGVEGADRRTRLGTLLRRTSLDELPQLLNVLRGEMSLVGPRPERPEYVARFTRDVDRYTDRHRLKSGITGLAQVRGLRGKTSIGDRVAYDNHYVEHWSPWLDVKILLRTARAVLHPAE